MKTIEELETVGKYNALDVVINYLKNAREYAIVSGLDHHFVSEIDNLISTAEANKESEAAK